jgi:hypothetical protein
MTAKPQRKRKHKPLGYLLWKNGEIDPAFYGTRIHKSDVPYLMLDLSDRERLVDVITATLYRCAGGTPEDFKELTSSQQQYMLESAEAVLTAFGVPPLQAVAPAPKKGVQS